MWVTQFPLFQSPVIPILSFVTERVETFHHCPPDTSDLPHPLSLIPGVF